MPPPSKNVFLSRGVHAAVSVTLPPPPPVPAYIQFITQWKGKTLVRRVANQPAPSPHTGAREGEREIGREGAVPVVVMRLEELMRRGRGRSGGGRGARGGEGWVAALAMRNRKPSLWQGVQTAKVEEGSGVL
jgi:hypothetical protein